MRRFAFAGLLFAFACHTAARQPEPKPKGDFDHLLGVWEIVGLEAGGKAEPEKNYRGNTFTFSRDKGTDRATLREGVNVPPVEFAVTLDAAKTPKAIDLAVKGSRVLGIYKLSGDDLTLCVTVGGPQRPAEFATKAGGDTELFTLKRSKWERYTDNAFGFAADFPGKPAESKREEPVAGGKVTVYHFSARGDAERLTYTVSVTPLPARLDGRDADAALDAAQKVILAEAQKGGKARVEEGKGFEPPAGVSAARDLTVSVDLPDTKDRDAVRVRLMVAGDRLYGLAVSGPEEAARSAYAGRFWSSFRLPPAEKKKDPPGK